MPGTNASRQQARRPRQAVAAAAPAHRQEIVHCECFQTQVFSGLCYVLVACRQWAGLPGREERTRKAKSHSVIRSITASSAADDTIAGDIDGYRHQEEANLFGKPESHHGQDIRSADRRHEQRVLDVFGRRHGANQ